MLSYVSNNNYLIKEEADIKDHADIYMNMMEEEEQKGENALFQELKHHRRKVRYIL